MLLFPSPVMYTMGLLISFSLICLFSPEILPLSDLHRNLDDLSLFRKALHPPKKISHFSSKPTSSSPPKIAFLFLTNSPLAFAPLWDMFFSAGDPSLFNVYVHADPLSHVPNPGGVFASRFIPAKKTSRGSPSLISAERRLLARAILHDPLNLYFALISQHCVPLHSFRYIYTNLFSGGGDGFRAFADQSRHLSFIEILSDDPNLPDRYNARGENAMLPEVRFADFRVGSQFFVMAKRHAMVVLKDRKLWGKFKMPCLDADACYPEEHYFPTLLSMVDPAGCTGFTLTNVNWTDCFDGHPVSYRASEVNPSLIQRLRKSNSSSDYSFFFARKFDPDCLPPLMGIADVIFRD